MVSDFDSVILDECHHAIGNHPMAIVCEYIRNSSSLYKPLILGLTASPIVSNKGSVTSKVSLLERSTGCRLITSEESVADLKAVMPRPTFSILEYGIEAPHFMGGFSFRDICERQDMLSQQLRQHGDVIYLKSHCHMVLLHAYARLRYTDNVRSICTYYQTLSLPCPFPMPSTLSSVPAAMQSKINLTDQTMFIGQILRLLESCGLLPTVHAFAYALTSAYSPEILKGKQSSKDCEAGGPTSGKRKRPKNSDGAQSKNKRSKLDENQRVSVTPDINSCTDNATWKIKSKRKVSSCIDLEQAISLKTVTENSVFNPSELLDMDCVVHSSLLECFAGLAAATGAERCTRAAGVLCARLSSTTPDENFVATCAVVDILLAISKENKPFVTVGSLGIATGMYRIAEGQCFPSLEMLRKALSCGCKALLSTVSPNEVCYILMGRNPTLRLQTLSNDGNVVASSTSTSTTAEKLNVNLKNAATHGLQPQHDQTSFDVGTVAEEDFVTPSTSDFTKYSDSHFITEKVRQAMLCLLSAHTHSWRTVWERAVSFMKESGGEFGNLSEQEIQNGYNGSSSLCFNGDWSGIIFCKMQLTTIALNMFQRSMTISYSGFAFPNATREMKNSKGNMDGDIIRFAEEKKKGYEYCSQDTYRNNSPIHISPPVHTKNNNNNKDKSNDNSAKFNGRNHDNCSDDKHDIPSSDSDPTSSPMVYHHLDIRSLNKHVLPVVDVRSADCSHSLPSSKDTVASSATSSFLKCYYLTGNATSIQRQRKVLSDFKCGDINILYATDVAEEGLDIQSCKFVLNFDFPDTIKSYVQRRGRARSDGSHLITMIPQTAEGTQMLADVRRYIAEEEEIDGELSGTNDNLRNDQDDSLIMTSGNLLQEILMDTSKRSILGIQPNIVSPEAYFKDNIKKTPLENHGKTTSSQVYEPFTLDYHSIAPSSLSGELMLEDGEITDFDSTEVATCTDFTLHNELNVTLVMEPPKKVNDFDASQGCTRADFDSRVRGNVNLIATDDFVSTGNVIEESSEFVFMSKSGVRVDYRNSIETLMELCQKLPLEKPGIHRLPPVFWMCPGFRCAVLLPKTISPAYRCVLGPQAAKKNMAKAMAALECIKILYQRGALGDDFRSTAARLTAITTSLPASDGDVNNVLSTSPSSAQATDLEAQSTATPSQDTNSNEIATANDESVTISVKVVPDSMTADAVQQLIVPSETLNSGGFTATSQCRILQSNQHTRVTCLKRTKLYLYAVRAYPSHPDLAEVKAFLSCDSCYNKLYNLNRIGIALPSEIPAECISDSFNMSLRSKYPLTVHVQYLGPRDVSDEELLQMQVMVVRIHYKSIQCLSLSN